MLKDRDDEKYIAKKSTKKEEKVERTGEKDKAPKPWHGYAKK